MCILLVEDEFLIREMTQMVLEDFGLEVLGAGTGREACDHVRNFPGRFSGLVTDFHMPGGVTGKDVIQLVRPLYPTIPIVLATAHRKPVTEDWLRRHSTALLNKPFEANELIRQLGQPLH